MPRVNLFTIITILLIVVACTSRTENFEHQKKDRPSYPYQVETVATGLDVPWEMDFAPDGRIFFTERSGKIRVIQDGRLVGKPVISFDTPLISEGEGGLLGLVLDPDFATNHYLYVYQTYEENGERKNRVLRLKEYQNQAKMDRVLIDQLPGASNHNGGRIKIGPDQLLYITTGDRYDPPLAQDRKSLGGKILRIHLDGTIPKQNPFPHSPVYSYGHRNPQGLAWHPTSKQLYSSEHGQSAHDEINLIKPGENYGWPLIQGDQSLSGLQTPLLHSGFQTWAPSGMTFVRSGPWKNDLLVAALRGERLLKIRLKGAAYDQVAKLEEWWVGEFGRIRNIYQGPDGSLYLMTNNRDGRGTPKKGDDRIIRLKPRNHVSS